MAVMTHRTSADYYAGIPQYGQQQLAAQNDRLRTAIREALNGGPNEPGGFVMTETPRRILENALNVEGMNQ